MHIKVLLVDNETLFCHGIRAILSSDPQIEVVGESFDGITAVSMTSETRPHIVLMETYLPGISSFEVARSIKHHSDTKVVFLTSHTDNECVREAILIADGYILKESEPAQLMFAIKEIHAGGFYMSPLVLMRLVKRIRTQPGFCQVTEQPLTRREFEVIKMLAEGKSVKEIATILNLSVKTVEVHKYNLMCKLGLHKQALLVQYAIANKIVPIPITISGLIEVE